ncbi:hypothetical protein Nepgr_027747 [Nepenthes gracilis]|uniref:Uncharacterized protein n=1 Tax=Nepenthes gracilis TaxID=150966 RepID=A0AAD3Y3E8_NEPGR|nr:hypothetical protein Nepgr_027747 [Nepenthes gracilis]
MLLSGVPLQPLGCWKLIQTVTRLLYVVAGVTWFPAVAGFWMKPVLLNHVVLPWFLSLAVDGLCCPCFHCPARGGGLKGGMAVMSFDYNAVGCSWMMVLALGLNGAVLMSLICCPVVACRCRCAVDGSCGPGPDALFLWLLKIIA